MRAARAARLFLVIQPIRSLFSGLVVAVVVVLACKARFKRRTLHVPNLKQMSENNRFFSIALDSAHVKFDV